MNITSKHIVGALIGSLSLLAVAASSANANYLGMADGNPGPADIWAQTHPDMGKVTHSYGTPMGFRAPRGCAGLREAAMETGSRTMWHRYHMCVGG